MLCYRCEWFVSGSVSVSVSDSVCRRRGVIDGCAEFGCLVDLSASGVNFADFGVWAFVPRMLVLARVQRSDFQASKRSGS